MAGGGGTSFTNALNYVEKNHSDTKFVVYLTDGYGDKVEAGDYKFKLLWVLSKQGDDSLVKTSGSVIKHARID